MHVNTHIYYYNTYDEYNYDNNIIWVSVCTLHIVDNSIMAHSAIPMIAIGLFIYIYACILT